MGFFGNLDVEKYDRKYSDRELTRRIIEYFKPQRNRLILVAVLVLAISGLGAASPIVVSQGMDHIKSSNDPLPILGIGLLVLAIGVISWFANWLRRRIMTRAIADTVLALARHAFEKAIFHDMSFYDQFATGKVVSRITSDTRDFGQLVGLITDLVSQVLETVVISVVLVRLDWKLSLILFIFVPCVFAMTLAYRRLARIVTKRGMQAMAQVNSTIRETISGISIAKNFRQEQSIYTEFMNANTASYKINVIRGLALSIVFPSLNAVGGVVTAVLVYFGGISTWQGLISYGSWYLFILSMDRFLFPVMNLASFWAQVQNGLSASERVFALIDAESKVKQTGNKSIPHIRGKIDFMDVDFLYKENEPVLEKFSLTIHPGESLAIVGHTGAGKSSIARLISRFYEFDAGDIFIDDVNIRDLDLQQYRKQIGIVSQTPFLFSGTIIDNIKYYAPAADRDEIIQISRRIGEGAWLEGMRNGWDTEVGERGSQLSMGQRQLVALMRVLVQKPSIFILDEATASIDPFTEWQIQQALKVILSQTTSIVIAHRLSTVKKADRIIVLENGRIIEEGTHDNLLHKGGYYAELFNTYFRHQSLEYIEKAKGLYHIAEDSHAQVE